MIAVATSQKVAQHEKLDAHTSMRLPKPAEVSSADPFEMPSDSIALTADFVPVPLLPDAARGVSVEPICPGLWASTASGASENSTEAGCFRAPTADVGPRNARLAVPGLGCWAKL